MLIERTKVKRQDSAITDIGMMIAKVGTWIVGVGDMLQYETKETKVSE